HPSLSISTVQSCRAASAAISRAACGSSASSRTMCSARIARARRSAGQGQRMPRASTTASADGSFIIRVARIAEIEAHRDALEAQFLAHAIDQIALIAPRERVGPGAEDDEGRRTGASLGDITQLDTLTARCRWR